MEQICWCPADSSLSPVSVTLQGSIESVQGSLQGSLQGSWQAACECNCLNDPQGAFSLCSLMALCRAARASGTAHKCRAGLWCLWQKMWLLCRAGSMNVGQ